MLNTTIQRVGNSPCRSLYAYVVRFIPVCWDYDWSLNIAEHSYFYLVAHYFDPSALIAGVWCVNCNITLSTPQ